MNMHIVTLFDIDNILIESSAGHRQEYREAVKEVYGIKVDIDHIFKFILIQCANPSHII